ncbi:hypothetical protein OA067_04275 [Gammaproteobacteria bacterium]|nr:hypothetical protein [Gammaproteobacteria bacterium]
MTALKFLGIAFGLILAMFFGELIVWQFARFGSLWGILVSIIVAIGVLVALAWIEIKAKEENPETESFGDGELWLIPSLAGFYIFMLAPFWNPTGYCAQQMYIGNVINLLGQRTGAISAFSAESMCLRGDAIDYMNFVEWIIIIGLTFFILLFPGILMYAWLSVKIEEFRDSRKDDFKFELRPVSKILEGLRLALDEKTYRKNKSEIFQFRFPTDRMDECTKEEQELVIKYYQELIDDLPNVYTKESESKTLEGRIKSVTKKMKAAQTAIDKLEK